MSIDTTEIGIVASKVMDDLEAMQKSGDVEDDARVVAVLVTYEVRSVKEGTSMVGGQCTDDSNTIGLGLLERMRNAILNPDDE